MAVVRLLLPGDIDLLPPDHIFLLEDRAESSAKPDNDIYGNPVVTMREFPEGSRDWTVGAAYVPLAVVDACVEAYQNHTMLTFISETGAATSCLLREHPINATERNKTVSGDVVYTIKLTLHMQDETWAIPVISTNGPRQYGR